MKRTFVFALGDIHTWNKADNRANLLKYIKKFPVSGVELNFGGSEKEMLAFRLKKHDRDWLRSLEYVSIHAPSLKKDSKKILDFIARLYKEVNAKNVVIHPDHMPPKKLLDKYKMRFSVENLMPSVHFPFSRVKRILENDPRLWLCLDVCHAYLWSKDETARIVKQYKNRIAEVHFSGAYRRMDHTSLRIVTKRFIESIQPVKRLNVPFVLEENMLKKSIQYVKDEIEEAKKVLDI